MEEIIRLDKITFETHLKYEDIMEIVEQYVNNQRDEYEIDKQRILYDFNSDSYITKGPVWIVYIKLKNEKIVWSDPYISLAISDKERRLVYIQNDHGVVIKKF